MKVTFHFNRFSERKFVSDRTAASTGVASAALKSPAIMAEEVSIYIQTKTYCSQSNVDVEVVLLL